MPEISQITLPSGSIYNIKDATARQMIEDLDGYTAYLGVTTTALTDGATTNPITINGQSVTAKTGNIANYGSKEFIFNGTAWQEFGDLTGLGDLAFKDSASGSFTPAGTVSQPTFSGTTTPNGSVTVTTKTTANQTATVSSTSGTATYTPEGTVAAPTITVTPSTATVNSIDAVGTLPEFTATVANEILTLGFNQGTLPTKGSNQTVVTGITSATATAPAFTGTGARLVTGNISVPSTFDATFTGSSSDVSGTVSQPSFTGTPGAVTVS